MPGPNRYLSGRSTLFSLLAYQAAISGADIQVIGAGFGRTGTLTLQAALQILGFRTYHFIDFSHAELWAAYAEGRSTADPIFDAISAAGYNATADNPSADLYAEQLRRFPKAKVILTVRDNPQVFERSWRSLMRTVTLTDQGFSLTFPSFFQWIPLLRRVKAVRCMMGTHLKLPPCALIDGWRLQPEGWIARQYEAHNALVKGTVPARQLLVYNVKEGWKPLCAFLGVKVPDVPFPNASVGLNDAAGMRRLRFILLVIVYSWLPCTLLLFYCAVRGCRGSGRRLKTD